jgi:hypothetical protein
MLGALQNLRRFIDLHPTAGKILLGCGLVGSAWWVAIDVVGSLRYRGYSYVDYTISELSAQGAPTRLFMTVASGTPYALLLSAFGVTVWATAGECRAQRVAGALIVVEVVWGFAGGILFPMAPRGSDGTLRNQMHAFYGIGMPILFLLAMSFGSRALGTRFRMFTYVGILALLVFGFLTSMQSGKIPHGDPTPYLGFIERANAYTSMLWLAALSIALLRVNRPMASRRGATPATVVRDVGRGRGKLPA